MSDSTSRLYAGAADLQALLDLLIAVRPAERIAEYARVVDLGEMLEIPNLQANTRLWEDGARQLVGFAIMDVTFGYLLFEANPQASSDIETQIIAWGIEHTRRGEALRLWVLARSLRGSGSRRTYWKANHTPRLQHLSAVTG